MEEVDVDKLKEMVHVKDEVRRARQVRRPAEAGAPKIRKELWFGLILMAIIIAGNLRMLLSVARHQRPPRPDHAGAGGGGHHAGLPTAFTLMGMGMFFTWLAYDRDWHNKALDLMVQRPSRR